MKIEICTPAVCRCALCCRITLRITVPTDETRLQHSPAHCLHESTVFRSIGHGIFFFFFFLYCILFCADRHFSIKPVVIQRTEHYLLIFEFHFPLVAFHKAFSAICYRMSNTTISEPNGKQYRRKNSVRREENEKGTHTHTLRPR